MAGSLTIPNSIGAQSGPTIAGALFDQDYAAIATYVNAREVSAGALASRPAATTPGLWYFASDVNVLFFATGAVWIAVGTPAGALRGYLGGLGLSNDGVAPNTTIDVAAGACASSDQTLLMQLGAFKGTTAGTWVVGTGQTKLDAGVLGVSQWWNVFVVGNDGIAADLLFSMNPTAPTLPAGYGKKRRLGAFFVDGSGNIVTFVQMGDFFQWKTPFTLTATNPGASAVLNSLSVPTGLALRALVNARLHQDTTTIANLAAYFSDPATVDLIPYTQVEATLGVATQPNDIAGQFQCRTDTSGRIRSRLFDSDANTALYLSTLGWWDRRGQDD